MVVSSAYCDIFMHLLSPLYAMVKPFNFGFFLVLDAKVCTQSMNNSAESGHPCLTPRLSSNAFDNEPLFLLHAIGLLYNILTHHFGHYLFIYGRPFLTFLPTQMLLFYSLCPLSSVVYNC